MTMELSVPQLEVAEETDETFGRIVAEPFTECSAGCRFFSQFINARPSLAQP